MQVRSAQCRPVCPCVVCDALARPLVLTAALVISTLYSGRKAVARSVRSATPHLQEGDKKAAFTAALGAWAGLPDRPCTESQWLCEKEQLGKVGAPAGAFVTFASSRHVSRRARLALARSAQWVWVCGACSPPLILRRCCPRSCPPLSYTRRACCCCATATVGAWALPIWPAPFSSAHMLHAAGGSMPPQVVGMVGSQQWHQLDQPGSAWRGARCCCAAARQLCWRGWRSVASGCNTGSLSLFGPTS